MNAFALFRRLILVNCREASRLQSEALDRSLSASESSGLKLHLLCCRWCRRYGQQLRFLRIAARDQLAGPIAAPHQLLSEDARLRIKEKLRRELD